jgi:hypothetical protein
MDEDQSCLSRTFSLQRGSVELKDMALSILAPSMSLYIASAHRLTYAILLRWASSRVKYEIRYKTA